MRPELYARISEKLVFSKLTYDVQLDIARLLLAQELEFLRAKDHSLEPAENVLPFLVRRGFHPRLGARPMRDAVEKSIGDAVASDLLEGGNGSGKLIVRDDGNQLQVRPR
jgi:ATP-dependent Clp protease ATP-binding subunit ClpA